MGVAGDDSPALTVDEHWAATRAQRDTLLQESDRTQLLDYPISAETRAAWVEYRRALRDLPQTYADNPEGVVWPVPPESPL